MRYIFRFVSRSRRSDEQDSDFEELWFQEGQSIRVWTETRTRRNLPVVGSFVEECRSLGSHWGRDPSGGVCLPEARWCRRDMRILNVNGKGCH